MFSFREILSVLERKKFGWVQPVDQSMLAIAIYKGPLVRQIIWRIRFCQENLSVWCSYLAPPAPAAEIGKNLDK